MTKKSKELKQKEALQRNEAWRNLPKSEKIASLDRRFGKGKGASKQRRKINS